MVARALAERLGNSGVNVELMTFPGRSSGTLGKLIYELHHALEAFSAAKQALHIALHLDVIEWVILPTLIAGRHVVLDRFWWSTGVYGMVDGVLATILDALADAEWHLWGSRAPTSVIPLDRGAPIDRGRSGALGQPAP